MASGTSSDEAVGASGSGESGALHISVRSAAADDPLADKGSDGSEPATPQASEGPQDTSDALPRDQNAPAATPGRGLYVSGNLPSADARNISVSSGIRKASLLSPVDTAREEPSSRASSVEIPSPTHTSHCSGTMTPSSSRRPRGGVGYITTPDRPSFGPSASPTPPGRTLSLALTPPTPVRTLLRSAPTSPSTAPKGSKHSSPASKALSLPTS